MRERGRKNRTSATMLAGWKKAVVLMLALIMCISKDRSTTAGGSIGKAGNIH